VVACPPSDFATPIGQDTPGPADAAVAARILGQILLVVLLSSVVVGGEDAEAILSSLPPRPNWPSVGLISHWSTSPIGSAATADRSFCVRGNSGARGYGSALGLAAGVMPPGTVATSPSCWSFCRTHFARNECAGNRSCAARR
jgi:hypothetical protein